MNISNYEFKARVSELKKYEQLLLTLNPRFQGVDNQKDTYYNTDHGRLKLREGNIEHALIHYTRVNRADAKISDVILYKHRPSPALNDILSVHLGVKVIVVKKRKIYFIENVKIHMDEVERLGTFLEVEAINEGGNYTLDFLQEQCAYYLEFFGIDKTWLINYSYSDLLLQKDTPGSK